VNASRNVARRESAREPGKVDQEHVEHRQAEHDEQHGDAGVEPRRRVDRAEGARGENDDKAEHAVDERHRAAVRRAKQKATAARSRLRAGADDREVDRNHREHARREVQRESAEQHEQEDRDRPPAFEHPAFLHALFGVVNEPQELVLAEVSTRRRQDDEVVELSNAVVSGRRRPCDRRRRHWRHRGLFAFAERNAVEQRVVGACDGRGCGNDAYSPLNVGGRRRITEVGVARLISQVSGDDDIAWRDRPGQRDAHADGELVLEHRQRLIDPGLLQVGGRGKHMLINGHARRRVDRQNGWDERRVARLV
jgi:hypothetical protein